MTAKEWLESTFNRNNAYHVRPRAQCADGFSISIQGGTRGHYCEPREHCDVYNMVELGYPSAIDDMIAPYAESENTTDTVFGYVPIEVVEQLAAKHGGITGKLEAAR